MNRLAFLLLLLLIACGKGEGEGPLCRPQEIAILECRQEEWEKNPNSFSIDFQKQYCENKFPFNICYAY